MNIGRQTKDGSSTINLQKIHKRRNVRNVSRARASRIVPGKSQRNLWRKGVDKFTRLVYNIDIKIEEEYDYDKERKSNL